MSQHLDSKKRGKNEWPANGDLPVAPYDVAAASTPGVRGVNEDSYFVAALKPAMAVQHASSGVRMRGEVSGPPSALVMIVADGLGGLTKASLASRLAVEEAASFTLENVVHGAVKWRRTSPASSRMTIPGLREQLTDAIQASDERVRAETGPLGSTITLSYLVWPLLYTAHVGDTRAYVIRGKRLIQLTQDHRLSRPLDGLGSDGAVQHWHHLLWNTLGDPDSLARPDLSRCVLEPHDQWLLCSDGLHGTLDESTIIDVCYQSTSASEGVRALVEAARSARAEDDVTVVYGRQCYRHSA